MKPLHFVAASLIAATLPGLFVSADLGCTAAQLTAFDQALAAGQAALVPVENLTCIVASEVDPSGATAICTEVDSAGTAIGQAITVVENVPAIQALVAKTSPKLTPTILVVLHTASTKLAASHAGVVMTVASPAKPAPAVPQGPPAAQAPSPSASAFYGTRVVEVR